MDTLQKYEQPDNRVNEQASMRNRVGPAYYVENYYGYSQEEIAQMKENWSKEKANYYLAKSDQGIVRNP